AFRSAADEPGGAGGPARPFRGDREPAVCSGAEGLFAGGTLRADQNQALPALAGASAGAGGLFADTGAGASNPAALSAGAGDERTGPGDPLPHEADRLAAGVGEPF